MSSYSSNEGLQEMYIFETSQQLELLETTILECESANGFTSAAIQEIFRIMHTIKGSSAMMEYSHIENLAHKIEDLFELLRVDLDISFDYVQLSDILFNCIDFVKVELVKIKNEDPVDGSSQAIVDQLAIFMEGLGTDEAAEDSGLRDFQTIVYYEEDCEMENLRALTLMRDIEALGEEISSIPSDLSDHEHSIQEIRDKGLTLSFKSFLSHEELHDFFARENYIESFELKEIATERTISERDLDEKNVEKSTDSSQVIQHSILSVQVSKLDLLMDLIGEMVIAEAMVTQNPEVLELQSEQFQKASGLLHKITGELQDAVMSIRMIPIASLFQSMQRIVRDATRKLEKDIELVVIGEETEVDRNIIEHISDPLMHLVRNALDHGIEMPDVRVANGKPEAGSVTLEARNAGNEVQIIINDDGKGLDKEHILQKAKDNGLLDKPESEMTDQEIHQLIFKPGFSTQENVTELSGRGVGMDVVMANLQAVRGTLAIDSEEGVGTTITMKIPLTLAIIDGMNIKVGSSNFTVPTLSIQESFRPEEKEIIRDPDNREMILVRGECLPIIRLHDIYDVRTDITELSEGILIILEENNQTVCVFADELIGQQQVVVKTLPDYIVNTKDIRGLAGCTLLGDGSISLIIDAGGLIKERKELKHS